jgi:hypothetical protein
MLVDEDVLRAAGWHSLSSPHTHMVWQNLSTRDELISAHRLCLRVIMMAIDSNSERSSIGFGVEIASIEFSCERGWTAKVESVRGQPELQ